MLAGTLLGLGATWLALGAQPPFGAVRSGPWTAWPDSGTADADPYARAIFARDGRLPLAGATGLAFLADKDDTGDGLDGRCSYGLSGPTPQAQFWTLTPLDRAGQSRAGAAQRAGFTSAEVVRDASGGFTIVLGRTVQSGNWLPLTGNGPFQLMLTFYDTPLTAALNAGSAPPALPGIAKLSCG